MDDIFFDDDDSFDEEFENGDLPDPTDGSEQESCERDSSDLSWQHITLMGLAFEEGLDSVELTERMKKKRKRKP